MLAQFVVESQSSKKDTDYIYIKEFLYKYYHIRESVKLNPVYLSGKTNYDKKEKQINCQINRYLKSQYEDDRHVVFLCVDFDDPLVSNNKQLNNKITEYCKKKGYELVWFNRDIEEVFLGRRIPKDEKIRTAKEFYIGEKIDKVDIFKLGHVNPCIQKSTSNLMLLTDKYFGELKK